MICPLCNHNVDLVRHTETACLSYRWRAKAPHLYRTTDRTKLPNQTALTQAEAWVYGSRGLMLVGSTGQGKSRVGYIIAEREHLAGRSVEVFDCVGFGHQCADKFFKGEGERWVVMLSKVNLVMFDDIDKARFTDRVESELFGIVERRVAAGLPVMATTQLKGAEIAGKFGAREKGSAIVRRLREFCDVVKF